MAKVKANKRNASVVVALPECPVCLKVMSAPIFICQSGHSLCGSCTSNLRPSICPICREPMLQMRNWALEEQVSQIKVPCPNKSKGCVCMLTAEKVDDHIQECIFREMQCPVGAAFGKCSWSGQSKFMMDHFKDRHPDNCNISTDTDVELDNICLTNDERHVYLVKEANILFLLTVKIDITRKMAYWVIQCIGSKKTARRHVYEIHVISKQNSNRKAMFSEYCLNEALKPDDIFGQGKCGIVPFNMLNQFIKKKKILFRFFIKRITMNPNKMLEKGEAQNVGPSTSACPGPRSASLVSGGATRQSQNNHPFNFTDK